MAQEAWEDFLLSVDIQNISTIDLPDQFWASSVQSGGCKILVDDLDCKGDGFFSIFSEAELQSQQ